MQLMYIRKIVLSIAVVYLKPDSTRYSLYQQNLMTHGCKGVCSAIYSDFFLSPIAPQYYEHNFPIICTMILSLQHAKILK